MPRRRALSRYPKEYARAFVRAKEQGRFFIRTSSALEARRTRNSLYGYRDALRFEQAGGYLTGIADRCTFATQNSPPGLYIIHQHDPDKILPTLTEALHDPAQPSGLPNGDRQHNTDIVRSLPAKGLLGLLPTPDKQPG